MTAKRVERWMSTIDEALAGAQDWRVQFRNLRVALETVLREIDADLEDQRSRKLGGGEPRE